MTQDVTQSADRNREAFTSALRQMSTQEGSTLAFELMQSLEEQDPNLFSLTEKSKGVTGEYLDSLERVSVKDLQDGENAECPICTNRFSDDEYPLIVRLPCHVQTSKKTGGHIFDLECVGPWLKVNSTCPICRFDVQEADKKRRERLEEELRIAKEEDSEEEEGDWDVYG